MSADLAAQGLTQFNNGGVADADELNANFSVLEQRFNELRLPYEVNVAADGIRAQAIARIDHTSMLNLCGDASGCTVRICRFYPYDPKLEIDIPECQSLRHVAYIETLSRWRAGTLNDGGVGYSVSTDGDGNTSNLLNFSECALSDGDSLLLTLNDSTNGLSLVNSSNRAGYVCSIVLSD